MRVLQVWHAVSKGYDDWNLPSKNEEVEVCYWEVCVTVVFEEKGGIICSDPTRVHQSAVSCRAFILSSRASTHSRIQLLIRPNSVRLV